MFTRFSPPVRSLASMHGSTMIEVLVTMVVIALGLLGMAGLQTRSHSLEFESYQRGQALILLQDMIDRMNGNAANAASYVTTGVGTGSTPASDCSSLGSRAATDLCEWSKALLGASEMSGTTKQGAMIGGLGCVKSLGSNAYLVSVVWQGMTDTVPPVTVCGQNSYSSENARRAVTGVVLVPDLGAS